MDQRDKQPTSGAPDAPGIEQRVTPERIFRIYQGYQLTAALKAGISLGVFDEIADGRCDAPRIAAALGSDERGTALLLDALAAAGLLERGEGDYRLAPDVGEFLVRGRPGYIGDAADVFVNPWHWDRFGRLADSVRSGGSVLQRTPRLPDIAFGRCSLAATSVRATPPPRHSLTCSPHGQRSADRSTS